MLFYVIILTKFWFGLSSISITGSLVNILSFKFSANFYVKTEEPPTILNLCAPFLDSNKSSHPLQDFIY